MRGKKVKGIVPKGGASTNPIQNMAEKLSTKEVVTLYVYSMHCILQGHSFIIYIFLALVNEWLHHGWPKLLLRGKKMFKGKKTG